MIGEPAVQQLAEEMDRAVTSLASQILPLTGSLVRLLEDFKKSVSKVSASSSALSLSMDRSSVRYEKAIASFNARAASLEETIPHCAEVIRAVKLRERVELRRTAFALAVINGSLCLALYLALSN